MTPEEELKMQMLIEMLKKQGDYSPSQPTSPSYAPPQQAQGSQGPSPAMAMNFIPQGGGAAGGASSGGSSAAGGGMGAVAAPAALVLAIAANETYQNKSGNRPKDFSDQVKEGLTGESLERDVERYFGDGELAQHMGRMGNPKGMYKNMKKSLKPWEWF